LGEDNSIKKIFTPSSKEALNFETSTEPWKPFPWFTCCCICLEYRGDFSCDACLGRTSPNAEISKEAYEWDYTKPSEENFNEVFVEINFHDALQRVQYMMKKVQTKIPEIVTDKLFTEIPRKKIVLKLETNLENIDEQHEKARKLIGFLSNNCNELFGELNEVTAYEKFRLDAVKAILERPAAEEKISTSKNGGVSFF
jgi:hypothetical protein